MPSSESTRSSLRTGHVDGDVGHRAVALRRSTGTGTLGALDGDFEVAPGGQPVEVVAGNVGVHPELLGNLGGGDTLGTFTSEQVDPPTGRVAERVGDGRHGAVKAPDAMGALGGFAATPVFYLSA